MNLSCAKIGKVKDLSLLFYVFSPKEKYYKFDMSWQRPLDVFENNYCDACPFENGRYCTYGLLSFKLLKDGEEFRHV